MAISDQLTLLNNTKQAIKTSINNKGGSVTDSTPFADYSTAIDNLPSGGGGNKVLDSIDVSDFSGTTFNTAASYITSVTIPSGVRTLGNDALQSCSRLTSITIPSGVTSIGNNAFYGCINISSLTIPSGVTSIGSSAFYGCSALTSINIPSGVTSIGMSTFNGCSRLTSITIPSGVTSIGNQAFSGCTGLTSITVLTPSNQGSWTPPTLGSNVFQNTNDCPIYVDGYYVLDLKQAWSAYASRIQAIPE